MTKPETTAAFYAACGVPPECLDRQNCGDANCEIAIAHCHEITEEEFHARILPDPLPKGLEVSAQHISDFLADIDCRTHSVKFDTNVRNNSDIALEINFTDYVTYDIPVFKGILQTAPTAFRFCLARKGNGGRDIIFSVHWPDRPVKYYDLSTDTPPGKRALSYKFPVCDDMDCAREVRAHHTKLHSEFITMLSGRTAERTYLGEEVYDALRGAQCGDSMIIARDLSISYGKRLPVYYPVSLLVAIFSEHADPSFFTFYRVNYNGREDIIFSVATEYAIEYYDLSTDTPPPAYCR